MLVESEQLIPMRMYGLHSEGHSRPVVQSTATYTRLPAREAQDYGEIARSATPLAALAPQGATHQVVAGDTLTRIVRDFLHSQGENPTNNAIFAGVREVAGANGITNADLIHPGQNLNLSVLLSRVSAADASGPRSVPPSFPESRVASSSLPTVAPRFLSAPADPLLGQGLTRSAAPIALRAMPPSPVIATSAPEELPKEEKLAVGGHVDPSITALQRLLNRTAGTLSMVRELMERDGDSATAATLTNPWEPVLRGAARLSSEYGMRKDPFTGRMAFHDGIDLAAKPGTEITALRDGEVIYSGWKSGYGNTVVVRHDNGYESLYGHTSKNLVTAGERVAAGTVIAEVGSTGRSTGPHLHLEVRRHGKPVNPLPHLEAAPLQLARTGTASRRSATANSR